MNCKLSRDLSFLPQGVKEALKKTGLPYLDLMLMHAPGDPGWLTHLHC